MSEELQTPEEPRERFIPIAKQEIVADLLAASHWGDEEQQQFGEFCQIFSALYHYKFYSHLEELKRCYAPFNPDSDIVTQHEYSDQEKSELHNTLINELRELLNNANYDGLTVDKINELMNADSYYGVSVSVDLDDFAEMITYYRGASTKVEYKRTWYSLFLRKKRFEIPIYKRFFFLLKFKTEDERVQDLLKREKAKEDWDDAKQSKFEKKARKQVQKSRQNLPTDVTDEHIFIKLFKNIPRTDLGMLFPNQNVRLKMFDKIKLSITGGGGTIGGIWTTVTKVTVAAVSPVTLAFAFAGLIGVIFRQIMNIFTQRDKYMMVLSRNLYFHNLDNNVGVMNFLIDMAEEEEDKEAILAYYFLHSHRDKNYTQEKLDSAIESYIQDKYGLAIDFEVEDGLRKLRQEGILIEEEGGILKVLDLQKACTCLDEQWDAFFNPAEEAVK